MLNQGQIRTIKATALQLLPKPAMRRDSINPQATNSDIVKQVPAACRMHARDCARLAPAVFNRSSARASMEAVWSYLRFGIRYQLDPTKPDGDLIQDTASPSAVEARGWADCKALSVYACSLLTSLGIPVIVRFASYDYPNVFTHVYVLGWDGNGWVVVDAVWPQFNAEKPFKAHKDFKMDLGHVSGVGRKGAAPQKGSAQVKKVITVPSHEDISLGKDFDHGKVTDGEMKLLLYRQRMAIKKRFAQATAGVGSVIDERFNDHLDVVTDMLAAYKAGDLERIDAIAADAQAGEYDMAKSMSGIGAPADRKKKREDKKVKRQEKQKADPKKPGGAIKKIAEGIKKAAGAAVKVISAVPRLLMKGFLEATLPKSAMAYLYLFINDANVIRQLPMVVRQKRDKAQKLHKFYTEVLGMKDDHLMGIYRNGILKQSGREPEAILRDALTKGKVDGIGLIGDIFDAVKEVIQWIAKNVGKGKNAPDFGKGDLPDLSKDFGGAASPGSPGALALAKQITDQGDDLDKLEASNDGDPGNVSNGRVKGGICSR